MPKDYKGRSIRYLHKLNFYIHFFILSFSKNNYIINPCQLAGLKGICRDCRDGLNPLRYLITFAGPSLDTMFLHTKINICFFFYIIVVHRKHFNKILHKIDSCWTIFSSSYLTILQCVKYPKTSSLSKTRFEANCCIL